MCWSVCLSVRKVYCGKMADWIQMPFGVVSGVSRGTGVLNRVVIIEGEGAVLQVNLGCPIVTNGDSDALFPNYFGEDLSHVLLKCKICFNVVKNLTSVF